MKPHYKFWPPKVPKTMEIGDSTLWDNVARQAEAIPNKVALHFLGKTFTWRQFAQEADMLAGALQSLGLEKGDRVALLGQNSPFYAIAIHAVFKAGAVVVPINPMNKAVEILHCVQDSGAKIAIVSDDLAAPFADVNTGLPDSERLEHLVTYSMAEFLNEPDAVPHMWRDWLCQKHELPVVPGAEVHIWQDLVGQNISAKDVRSGADDLALLMYTSGTTGLPKACMHSHRTIMANAIQPKVWQDLQMGDASLVVLPLFHITGLVGSLLASIYSGASSVFLPRWNRKYAAKVISEQRITHWGNIPTMVVDLLSDPELDSFDLSSLRYVGGGGAAMPDAIAKKLKAKFGLDYVEGYGLTETAAPTHCNPPHAPKFQCLGIPVINTEAMILNSESNTEAAQGEQGEIIVRGPQVFLGYWNKPKETKETFIELGGKTWFKTGDLGYMDKDGFYFIADRIKRMINSSGFKIWPAEVEGMFYTNPAVQEACIIAAKDDYRGQSAKAVIVLKPEFKGKVSADDIIAWAKTTMSAYKVPRIISFVDSLPKGGTGKILWRQLQEEQDALDKQSI